MFAWVCLARVPPAASSGSMTAECFAHRAMWTRHGCEAVESRHRLGSSVADEDVVVEVALRGSARLGGAEAIVAKMDAALIPGFAYNVSAVGGAKYTLAVRCEWALFWVSGRRLDEDAGGGGCTKTMGMPFGAWGMRGKTLEAAFGRMWATHANDVLQVRTGKGIPLLFCAGKAVHPECMQARTCDCSARVTQCPCKCGGASAGPMTTPCERDTYLDGTGRCVRKTHECGKGERLEHGNVHVHDVDDAKCVVCEEGTFSDANDGAHHCTMKKQDCDEGMRPDADGAVRDRDDTECVPDEATVAVRRAARRCQGAYREGALLENLVDSVLGTADAMWNVAEGVGKLMA